MGGRGAAPWFERECREAGCQSCRQLGLTAAQVRGASRYYAEFPDEIDAEIAANEEAADREVAVGKPNGVCCRSEAPARRDACTAVAVGLRGRGHDVVAVKERAEMIGLPDRELLLVTTTKGHALVTENVKDFAALHKTMTTPAEKHAGIVFTHSEAIARDMHAITSPALTDALARFLDEHPPRTSQRRVLHLVARAEPRVADAANTTTLHSSRTPQKSSKTRPHRHFPSSRRAVTSSPAQLSRSNPRTNRASAEPLAPVASTATRVSPSP